MIPDADRLFSALAEEKPDFETAEALIRAGASLNDSPENGDKTSDATVLARLIMGTDAGKGARMLMIVRWALAHGFDVNGRDGLDGAAALCALAYSSADRHIVTAAKLLLEAGAKNLPVEDADDTPFYAYEGEEGFYHENGNRRLCNLYTALCELMDAYESGGDWRLIDSFEAVQGKTISRILARGDGELPLWFETEDGGLLASEWGELWFDGRKPDDCELDVTEIFGLAGQKIEKIGLGKLKNRAQTPVDRITTETEIVDFTADNGSWSLLKKRKNDENSGDK